jgi:hypothetical protein
MTIHGWPLPSKVMWQGDRRWGSQPYGHGGKTIAQWGCTAASLAEAQRASGARAGATPHTVCERAALAIPPVWAPGSSLAVLPRLARSAGFACPDVEHAWTVAKGAMSARQMSIAICDAIDGHGLAPRRGFAWLHVDYTGDDVGEHWILALGYDDDAIYCTDSAPAKVIQLDRKTLTAPVMWGRRERRYRVVRGYGLVVTG